MYENMGKNGESEVRFYVEHLLKQKTSQRKDTLWFTAGTLSNSLASMLISLLVTRILGADEGGIFAISWAAAQLMLTVGWFSMRPYQVSDIHGQFAFKDYLTVKSLTSVIMVAGGFLYALLYRYDREKCLLTVLLCVFLLGEVFADVCSGFFQQKERLHLAGQSYTGRTWSYLLVFTAGLLLTGNLTVSVAGAMGVNFLWLGLFDFALARRLDEVKIQFRRERIAGLLKECFPLFISSFVLMFIMNVPKNAINTYLTNEIQACYNIIFLPSSVVNMFCMFACVPMYGAVAAAWHNKEKKRFLKVMASMFLYITGVTALVLLGGWFLGIPVLSVISGLDLSGYKTPLMLLLLSGGIYGGVTILNYFITVMRKQKLLLICYGAAAGVIQVAGTLLTREFGVMGAVISYLAAMAGISVVLFSICLYFMKKQ